MKILSYTILISILLLSCESKKSSDAEKFEKEYQKVKSEFAHEAFKKSSFIYNGLSDVVKAQKPNKTVSIKDLNDLEERIVNRTMGQTLKDFIGLTIKSLVFGAYNYSLDAAEDEIENFAEKQGIYLPEKAVTVIAQTLEADYRTNINSSVKYSEYSAFIFILIILFRFILQKNKKDNQLSENKK